MVEILSFSLLGAVVGSFVGVVAERAYTGHSFLSGRSKCNSCNRVLGPADLVPIFSWLFFKGRCRTCGSRVPAHYLALELMLALLFALSYAKLGATIGLALFLLVLAVLAFIVVYDLRHTVVPTAGSISLFIFSALFLLSGGSGAEALGGHFITAGMIGLAFLALHVFSKGRAMGLGDAPVAFSLSLLVAPHAVPGLLFSFWIGALCGLAILFLRRGGPKMGIEVPFVPFLAAGFLLAYFTGWNPLSLALL